MGIIKLEKTVLSVRNRAEKFLNGLSANTLEQPRNAFLDKNGKIIATFDQIKIGDDEFLIVMAAGACSTVLEHLDRYIKLSKAIVEKKDLFVYFDTDTRVIPKTKTWCIPQKAGQLVITEEVFQEDLSGDAFKIFRLKNNIPFHGADYQDTLLLNVNEDEFISYTKGCFLGQEPIAKVHSRSKPSYKLIVKAEDECSSEEREKLTSKAKDPETGRVLGFIFVANR